MFECIPATPDKLKEIWDYNIADNPDDPRWIRWGQQAMEDNRTGRTKTFLILCDGEPVGEGTLIFDPSCSAIDGRLSLADGRTVTNVNALRIRKEYENQGHVSAMMKKMEQSISAKMTNSREISLPMFIGSGKTKQSSV